MRIFFLQNHKIQPLLYDLFDSNFYSYKNSFIPKRNERSELVHSRMSAGKARVNTPRLAAEREPYERLRVQGLPWGMIPFICLKPQQQVLLTAVLQMVSAEHRTIPFLLNLPNLFLVETLTVE